MCQNRRRSLQVHHNRPRIFAVLLSLCLVFFATPVLAHKVTIFALVKGKINMKSLIQCLMDTGKTTAMIFLIIIGANIFSTFLGLARLPMGLADFIAALALPKIIILIGIILIFIALGCVMDCYAIMILTVPIILAHFADQY